MELSFETGALLLLIAAVVAMLTRRLRLPYSAGLVAAGMVLAILPYAPRIELTKQLLFTALLPPLIFEASFHLDWQQLRRDLPVVLVLATLGVALSAAVTAAGMYYLIHWDWLSCAAFGILIAATDPVSVIATFRETGAHGRLLVLVEAESIFNDGTAAVAFGAAILFASGTPPTPFGTVATLAATIGGGLMCGAVVACVALLLAGRTEDHLVEISFTTIAAYGSFLLAEHLHLSGVLATLTAGLLMANYRSLGEISPRGKEAVEAFWGIRRFPRQFAGIPADRHACDAGGSARGLGLGHRRHRVRHPRPGNRDLPLLPAVCQVPLASHRQTSAHTVLGRLARCPGAGPGSRVTPGNSHARSDCHRQLRGSGLLGVRARTDDDTPAPQSRRDLSGEEQHTI